MVPKGILLIDNTAESLSIEHILAEEGYKTLRVRDAHSGLAAITTQPPALILLEVHGDGVDGLEFARRLREVDEGSAIPILFLSTRDDAREWLEGLSLGPADFISAPIRRNELLARVQTQLSLDRRSRYSEEQPANTIAALRAQVALLMAEIEGVRKESEERFRTFADTAPVKIWVSGTDKRCTFVNKRWLNFTGRTLAQELGDGWTEGVHPDDLENFLAVYTTSFDARRSFNAEYRLRRADGVYRWIFDNGTPRFERDGTFAGYVGSCLDITDVKQAKDEHFDKQRVKSLRVLTSGIAHDFRNLMGSILSTAELAEAELSREQSCADEVDTIKTLALRAVEILRELMIYAGQDKGTFEAVDLSRIVDEMVGLLKTSIPKRIRVDMDLPDKVPPAWANPTHIRQVVMNLVLNASDAIGLDSGAIRISTGYLRREGLETPGTIFSGSEYVRLEISDTGCGMTEEQCTRIFDPYYTTKRSGHGLGLAVVHGIVQSHGGYINTISSPGKGSTFEVLLPIVRQRVGEGLFSVRAFRAS